MGTIGKVTAGGATHLIASTCYGTCSTAARTAGKVAEIQDSQAFTLITGITVYIKFTYSNTASSPTLNVNSTGAKAIKRYGTTDVGRSIEQSWPANAVVPFTYDGSYWQMCCRESSNGTSSANYAHAEGYLTTASGNGSHAEGYHASASGEYSHAEGYYTKASGEYSHAEGYYTKANAYYSHAEGYQASASGDYSHAEGYQASASGEYSHAEGCYTQSCRRSQHVFGEYNVIDTEGENGTVRGDYVEIVGNGTSTYARSNARTLDWNGNEVLAGGLTATTINNYTLGPACEKDIATSVTSGSTDLVTAGAVYTAIDNLGVTPHYYGTCTSAEDAQIKVATLINDQSFTLATGVTVYIKFTHRNSLVTPAPKLNVNSSGDISMKLNDNTPVSGGEVYYSWEDGSVVSFTYDGTNWLLNDRVPDSRVRQKPVNTNSDYRIVFGGSNDSDETGIVYKNTNLKYNPSTGNLQATQLNGVTVGNDPKFTDTTYESKAAASGGTALSLVTTGEKYTWNNKGSGTVTRVNVGTTPYSPSSGVVSLPAYPADANVTQTETTTNADYELLFSATADSTTRTEGARKSGGLLYNPSTNTLKTSSENPGIFAASEFDIIYQDAGGTAYQDEVISANNNGSLNLSSALKTAICKTMHPLSSIIELYWTYDPNTIFPGTTWVLSGYSDPLNLFTQQPVTFEYGSFNSDGSDSNTTTDKGNRVRTENFMFLIAGTYTISTTFATFSDTNYRIQHVLYAYDTTRTLDNNNSQKSWQDGPFTFTLTTDRYVRFGFRYANNASIAIRSIGYVKLVLGSFIPDITGNGSLTQTHKIWRRTA